MGGHTAKAFFEPTEEAPLGDFGHSIADGYVVVLYPTDLPAGDVDELKAWVLAEADISVAPTLTVLEGHAIAVEAHHRLLHEVPKLSEVTVHVSPAGDAGVEHHSRIAHHKSK